MVRDVGRPRRPRRRRRGLQASGLPDEPGQHSDDSTSDHRDAVGVGLPGGPASRRDFDGRRSLDGFGAGDGEGASLVSTSHASGTLGAVETSALSSAQSLIAEVSIANGRIAQGNKQLRSDAECEQPVMGKKRSIEHVEGPFAQERTLHMRRPQGFQIRAKAQVR